jgi:hypothetical protein
MGGGSALLLSSLLSILRSLLIFQAMLKLRTLSPALLSRLGRLSGCRGRWIVDCREIEGQYGFALRSLSDHWPILIGAECLARVWHSLEDVPNQYKLNSLEDAAQYCAATGWQSRLLFSPDLLNADSSWPGGYEASSLHRSNNRTFCDAYSAELILADGDADGLALDIRFLTEDMIADIESLENYPLLSEDDHSSLEMEDQEKAWEDSVSRDFSRALEERLASISDREDAEDVAESFVESLSPDSLYSLFHALAESANTYWEEEDCYGWWIDTERIVKALSEEDALSLLSPSSGPLSPIESLLASFGRC